MTQEFSFGSGELTPELVRGAQFTEVDGRIDAAEVRTFLDRVASALDVFLSGDAQEALRKEFARNAAIAQQVLDAGQNASEQLRRHAAEDAKRILDETREATDRLRGDVERELEGSKRQVIEMRTRLMGDLRDLHDRIGASLYRFERAVEESPLELGESSAATQAPLSQAAESVPTPPATASAPPIPVPELAPIPAIDPIEVAPDVDIPDVPAPSGVPEPAWTQLPSDAWTATPEENAPAPELAPIPADVDIAPVTDPFAVVEDEPLAPGEPLIDLRELGSEPVGDVSDDERAAALLANLQDAAPTVLVAPPVDAETAAPAPAPAPALEPAPAPPPAPAADPAPPIAESSAATTPEPAPMQPPVAAGESGGDWLSAGFDDPMGAVDASAAPPAAAPQYPPQLGQPEQSAAAPPAAATPPPASADAMAVRQLILESFSAGQSREAIEAYLRDHMGFVEPGALIDAALASIEQQPGF